jgi:hypothetical protein
MQGRKPHLKNDGGGGVGVDSEQADALQGPLERHLVLLLLPPCEQTSFQFQQIQTSMCSDRHIALTQSERGWASGG